MSDLGPVSEAFTEAMKRARQSAVDLGDPMLGVGHLALGIIRSKQGEGYVAISNLGITMHELEAVVLDASRTELESSEAAAPASEIDGVLRLTAGAHQAIASAGVEVERLGHERLDTGHLLLGILRDRHSEVADALARFGATYETIVRELGAGTGDHE